jgi:hypothetical protein
VTDTQQQDLEKWIDQVSAELGCDVHGVETVHLLDVARDVAHHQIRPGAPTSTFVIGVALGRWEQERITAGSAPTTAERADKLRHLCAQVQQLALTSAAE